MKHLLVATLIFSFACDKAEEKTVSDNDKKTVQATDKTTTDTAVKPDKVKPTPPTPTPPTPTPPTPTTAPATKHTEFISKDHSFSVMAAHKARLKKVKAADGTDVTTYTLNAQGAPGAAMVVVATIPFGPKAGIKERKKSLKEVGDSLITKYNAVFSDDKEFAMDEHPGREVVFTANHPKMGKMAGRSKIVIRGNESYQVMWIGNPTATEFIAESNAVLDSFKFIE